MKVDRAIRTSARETNELNCKHDYGDSPGIMCYDG